MTTKNWQTCLSAEMLRQLSQDELSPAELEGIEAHVSGCDGCRNLLEVAQSDPQWRDEIVPILRTPLEPPPAATDHDGGGSEGESLESILRLLGPTDDPHMLGRIGSYEIVGVIGRGGMGVVFKAYEGALHRFVAIKMLLPHLAASGAARKRFAREGQAAAAVIDDNVMPIYSVAEWQGVPYLVTQFSRGATLQKRIGDQGPLELKEILRIGMQTARGLAAAHAQGLVHRDVKPSNILLDGTVERALLTDFGLARAVDDASITRSGMIAGTPQYMSPEQARGGSVDARSDLFGLGGVLYAMCTGRPPFRADSSYTILRMITDDEPRSIREVNPDIPEWLCLLISRLMAKSPDVRFGGALEVADLLEQCLAHVQQPTSVPLPASLVPHVAGRRSIFNVTRKGVIAMLGTIGVTLLGMVLWLAPEAPDISGQWTSEEWGTVVLEAKQPGQYEGTFTGSVKGKSGTVQLKWSRVEHRFNGTWRKDVNPTSLSSDIQINELISSTRDAAVDRSGKISLRLVDKEIRGAWTTSKVAQKESGTPRLGDLLWSRSQRTTSEAVKPQSKLPNTALPVIELPKMPETGAERKLPPVDGPPVHPKLADDRYAKSGVPLAEQTWPMPPWGAEKDGLSAGIRIIGDARIGGEVKAELWVRNSGAKDVTFSQCHRADVGLSVVAKDKDGKEHSADITQFRGYPIFSHWLLPPGHIAKVKEFTLKLGSRKNDELERGWVSLDLPPGDYKLRVKWSDSHALATHTGDWTGELTTDEVDLKIAVANAGADAAKPAAKRDWAVAWDFHYTLLNQRYAMMRISSDGKMEANFPGWRLLRTQLSPDELSALVALVAKNPNVQSLPIAKVAEYAQAVTPKPELVDSINKVNVRSEIVAVIHKGELLELDLDTSESAVVTNQLWKLVGLAAIGGSEKLPKLVDLANSELKRKYPEVSNAIDQTHFRFAIVDHPSGNISVWFNFNIDPGSKDGQAVLRIPEDGQPSIEQVLAPKGESPPDGAEKPTARATPKLPKLPDEAYTRTGIHCQKFREEDAKRPGGELMGDVVESKRGEDPLVLGMRVASDAKWNIGGQARVELVVRNASASDVKFTQTLRADNGLSVVAIDKDGKEHQAEIAHFDGWLVWNHLLLPPSHIVMVKSFTLRFDPEKRGVSKYGVAAFHLPPGDYTLRCKWNDARPEVAHEGEWTGELVSVEHKFKLAAAVATPPASETPKAPADREPRDPD